MVSAGVALAAGVDGAGVVAVAVAPGGFFFVPTGCATVTVGGAGVAVLVGCVVCVLLGVTAALVAVAVAVAMLLTVAVGLLALSPVPTAHTSTALLPSPKTAP